MANITDIERLNYYEGEFLGAVDFQTEQEYHRDMRRRHNLGPHTWGIVTGLELVQIPNGTIVPNQVDVYIQPGMAVDTFGREIVALTKTQLTQDLFAPYVDKSKTVSQPMYIWISYAQLTLQPPTDTCTQINQPNAFGRVQEAFALTVTQDSKGPTDNPLVVDGKVLPVPLPSPSQAGDITFPADSSIPYQEFSTDDSSVISYILLGQVLWYPNSGVFEQIDDSTAATGRLYAGSVTAAIFAPDATTPGASQSSSLIIRERLAPYPLPPDPKDPQLGKYYGGVGVRLAGSLSVDRLLEVAQSISIDGTTDADPNNANLSPLNITARGDNEDLIQFLNPSKFEKWLLCENPSKNPGLHIGEFLAGTTSPGITRLFIQATLQTPPPPLTPPPSTVNVGIGTVSPRNPLAIRAQGDWEELLSFEDTKGNTNWHLNQNPQGPGLTRGLNFCETKPNANFRLFLQEGGNVGIGTATPRNRLGIRGVLPTEELLSFEDLSGTTRWHLNQNRPGPARGLNFAETGVADFRLFLQAGGNVGIGTGAPAQKLSVSGAESAIHGFAAAIGISNTAPGGRNWYLRSGATGTGTPAGGFSIADDAAYRLVIDSSGNVGIGTITPSAQLEVIGPVKFQGKSLVQIYRLYNSGNGDHFYTPSAAERDNAVLNDGYVDETPTAPNFFAFV